ncbi:MAG: phage major capsid protein, partial [Candidatus Pacearchaeota archaeon]
PVRLVEAAPTSATNAAGTPFILLGNFNNSMLKDKQGMRIDTSMDAYVDATSLFQYDLSALRFIRHWSFHPALTEAYAAISISD